MKAYSKYINKISRICHKGVLLVLCMIFISACSSGDCVYANEFGDRTTASFFVDSINPACTNNCETSTCASFMVSANQEAQYVQCMATCVASCGNAVTEWIDSGLQATGEVFVNITGTVYTCPKQPPVAPAADPENNNYYIFNDGSGTFVPSSTATTFSPQTANWLTVVKNVGGTASPGGNLVLSPTEEIEIEIAGTLDSGASSFSNGEHLMVEVDMGTTPDPTTGNPLGVVSWELDEQGHSISRTEETRGVVDVIVHKIVVVNGGSLRLKYNDTHDSNYANNTNGYEIRVRSLGCAGRNGKYLQAKLGNNVPIDMSTQALAPWYPPLAQMGEQIYFRLVDPEGNTNAHFINNSGSYRVTLDQLSVEQIFSGIIEFVVDPIMDILYGTQYTEIPRLDDQGNPVMLNGEPVVDRVYSDGRAGGVVTQIYTGVVAGIRDIVRTALVLYIILWGFGFVIGSIKVSTYEFAIRIIKIAIILQLISDTSWEFFSDHLFNVFFESMNEFINMFTAHYGPLGGTGFEFMDVTAGIFFMDATWKKLAGLMLSGFIEFFYFICIIVAMFIVVVAFAHAMLIYLVSIIAIALLLSVAPIFLVFTLFQVTRSLFDGWLKHLVSYFLQPVLVMITLVLFTEILIAFLYGVLSFNVCWGCKIYVVIPTSDIGIGIPDLEFCLMEWYNIWGSPPANDNLDPNAAAFSSSTTFQQTGPRGLFAIIPLLIIADAMNKFTGWAVALALSITEAFNSSLEGAAESLAKTTGMNRLRNRAASMPGDLAMGAVNQATGGVRGIYNQRAGRSLQKLGNAVGSESLKKAGAKQELKGKKQLDGNIAANTLSATWDGVAGLAGKGSKASKAANLLGALTGTKQLKRVLVGKEGDSGLFGRGISETLTNAGKAGGPGEFMSALADGVVGPAKSKAQMNAQERKKAEDPYHVSDSEVRKHLAKKYGNGNSGGSESTSRNAEGGSQNALSKNEQLDRQGHVEQESEQNVPPPDDPGESEA